MIDINGKDLPEIDVTPGNGIKAYFDMQYFYDEIPAGRWGIEKHDAGYRLVGPGHGMRGAYGNGALWVPRMR